MLNDYSFIKDLIIGLKLPKPTGTLSGHNAGEPFEKKVYKILKSRYNTIFKQYEYLNSIYLQNPNAVTYAQKYNLFQSDVVRFLIQRGKTATSSWSQNHLFEEKQNDTADILNVYHNFYDFIDVKTRNIDKDAQPPNIISAYKLAKAMKIMLETRDFDSIDIVYIEIDWQVEGNNLVAKDCHIASLFKTDPLKLYINWSAAIQVQFHVANLTQNYTKTKEDWAKDYLKRFYSEATNWSNKIIKKFALPFKNFSD